MLDAELRHQLLLEVDHERMGATASYGLERVLVPVLDLVAERDEQLQVDPDGIVGGREALFGRPEGVPELRLPVDQDRVAVLVLVAVVDLVPQELGLKQVQPSTDHGADEVAIVPGRAVVLIHGFDGKPLRLVERVSPPRPTIRSPRLLVRPSNNTGKRGCISHDGTLLHPAGNMTTSLNQS